LTYGVEFAATYSLWAEFNHQLTNGGPLVAAYGDDHQNSDAIYYGYSAMDLVIQTLMNDAENAMRAGITQAIKSVAPSSAVSAHPRMKAFETWSKLQPHAPKWNRNAAMYPSLYYAIVGRSLSARTTNPLPSGASSAVNYTEFSRLLFKSAVRPLSGSNRARLPKDSAPQFSTGLTNVLLGPVVHQVIGLHPTARHNPQGEVAQAWIVMLISHVLAKRHLNFFNWSPPGENSPTEAVWNHFVLVTPAHTQLSSVNPRTGVILLDDIEEEGSANPALSSISLGPSTAVDPYSLPYSFLLQNITKLPLYDDSPHLPNEVHE
ncbi:hypothetical protein DL93DRAFT_1710663, partial [Clavulina sp. PMI_390]